MHCNVTLELGTRERQLQAMLRESPDDAQLAQKLLQVRRDRWSHCDACAECYESAGIEQQLRDVVAVSA